MNLTGFRTYLVSAGIIVHQGLKLAGIDVPDQLVSESVDGILAIAALYFRWAAAVKAKKDVEVALNTPVPTEGGK